MPDVAERALLVRDALAARQWEAALIDASATDAGRRAWTSPPLSTIDAWLARDVLDADAMGLEVLGRAQSDALWRRVVADSPQADELLERAGAARWAAEAWRLLADADIDPAELKAAPEQADFAAFLAWCADYRARLRAAGWLDAAETRLALRALDLPRGGRATLLDVPELSPVEAATLRRLEARDWRIERRAVPRRDAACLRVPCDDAEHELKSALRWAAARLSGSPRSRVAVVLRNGPGRQAAVDRALASMLAASGQAELADKVFVHRRGQDRPLVAAALNLLELLSGQGGFAHLSRWLRGPLAAGADVATRAAAALLELELRGELLAQVGFVDAYRRGGLRRRMLQALPALTERLDAALAAIERAGGSRSPARWAESWQHALRAAGWSEAAEQDPDALADWERGLEEFVALTPMLGECAHGAALDELATILRSLRYDGVFPLHGVHVLARIEQVGPGYDAAWVTGLTDTSLPEPARINPLLPRALQVAHDMPWATPADALRRAERSLAELRGRVDELVLSWPASEYDFATSPSPLIVAVPAQARDTLETLLPAPPEPSAPALVALDDAPLPHRADTIRGGAQTLNLQSRCPLRAFCQSRLGARPIEAPERGISPRHQGIVVHRALELLMARVAEGDVTTGEGIDAAIETALDEVFRGARRALATLYSLERARVRALLERFLDAETLRLPFTPEVLEARRDIEIGGLRVRVRIDRIDRLADGAIAILDYKTGRKVQRPGWFKTRLQDPQLPLYLLEVGNRVSCLVIAALEPGAVRYLGVWPDSEQFPGRALPLPEQRAWDEQRDVWRGQIEALVEEFARGDVRLFPDDLALAKGAYAPLSRFHAALTQRYREAQS